MYCVWGRVVSFILRASVSVQRCVEWPTLAEHEIRLGCTLLKLRAQWIRTEEHFRWIPDLTEVDSPVRVETTGIGPNVFIVKRDFVFLNVLLHLHICTACITRSIVLRCAHRKIAHDRVYSDGIERNRM